MNQLTEIIVRSGLLSDETIREIQRWGMPVPSPAPPDGLAVPPTAETVSRAIADAIESEGYILTRETDLEAIPRFLRWSRPAVLHVVADVAADINVQVSREGNEWLLPWQSDSITDLLTNGETYLLCDNKRFFFKDARELFYGKHKAFVVCTTSVEEDDVDR